MTRDRAEERGAGERFVPARDPRCHLHVERMEEEEERCEQCRKEPAAELEDEGRNQRRGACVQKKVRQVKAQRLEPPNPPVERKRPGTGRPDELLRPDSTDFVRRQKPQQIPGALPPERSDDGVVIRQEEPFQGSPMDEKAGHQEGAGAKKRIALHGVEKYTNSYPWTKANPAGNLALAAQNATLRKNAPLSYLEIIAVRYARSRR